MLAGDCADAAHGLELWRFTDEDWSWSASQLTLSDASLSADYLSAGFSFSPTNSVDDVSVYIFGGMCPNSSSNDATTWTSDATYSNTMLTLSPSSNPGATSPSTVPYQLSMTGERAPPIAEAGLSITSLPPTYSNSSSSNVSQQQNFVLLGGHTGTAFINMSQVALFSLPEESWSFLGVDQPPRGNVEPRSGHTAVMTEDGSKIIVFGGWVGNVSTPASPQLAILEIGQGYGGSGDWAWTIPSAASSPFDSATGIYGHGATMLPGDVMMVVGGFSISDSSTKTVRQLSNEKLFFYNTTSSSWVSTYTNSISSSSQTNHSSKASSGLKPAQKAGLGAGLGLGFAAVAGVVMFWLMYSRRLRQKRKIREKELRELALGAERYHSDSVITPVVGGRGGMRHPEMRSASWGSRQEKQIESSGDAYPWAPVLIEEAAGRLHMEHEDAADNGMRQAERTGLLMNIPSPTRGLRRSLHSKGPNMFGASFSPIPGAAPSVFRIDEEEEGSQIGSLKLTKTPKPIGVVDRSSTQSDPFKDPPPSMEPAIDEAAAKRKKEVQGWVDDWERAGSMTLSRNPSQAQSRTYSSLSHSQSQSQNTSGRGSPEKSDRTGSNLSDRSIYSTSSLQRSAAGTISRQMSQRSASVGYTLFSGAAAAMGRISGSRQPDYGTTNMDRSASKRSVSLNMNSTSSRHAPRPRGETLSSAHTNSGPAVPGEADGLLVMTDSRTLVGDKDYWMASESPLKERYGSRTGSLTSASRKALGVLGSVKRVFTGTGSVDVTGKVANHEDRSGQSSPTKPEMSEPNSAASNGPAFWRGKRGARDWDDDTPPESSTIQRKPVAGNMRMVDAGDEDYDSDEWDVESAVQKRVVQVMFTVPKEKLRVVNADSLSLISRSDVDEKEKEMRETEVKRMSSVKELDDGEEEKENRGKERETEA